MFGMFSLDVEAFPVPHIRRADHRLAAVGYLWLGSEDVESSVICRTRFGEEKIENLKIYKI